MPVIDTFVLRNLGLRLPPAGPAEVRVVRIAELHCRIKRLFRDYLESDLGHYLVARFEESYPDRPVTRVKMLDLILWRSRVSRGA